MTRLVIVYPADPLGIIPGGVDTYIRGLIRWAPEDIDISLVGITTDPSARPLGRWLSCNIGPKKFRFFAVLWEKHPGQRIGLPLSVRFVAGLLRYRPKFVSDVLEFHRIEPALFYLRRRPINLFVHQNMQILEDPNSDILWRRWSAAYYALERYVMSRADSIITVREDAVDWYRGRMPELSGRFRFVPTWVDPTVFCVGSSKGRRVASQQLRKEFGFSENDQVIITVGRLDRQKDPLLLASAFLTVCKSMPELRLVYMGDGVLRTQLESFITEHALGAQIKLAGLRSASQVARYLQGADLFALSSAYEGMPMCLLEALSSGLPAVSTRVGEVPRVMIQGENGFMVDYGDAEALASAMSKALQRPWSPVDVAATVSEYAAQQVLSAVYGNYRRLAGA